MKVSLQDMEVDAVMLGRRPQVRSDIVAGHGDGGTQRLCCRKRLGHRRRELPSLGAVAVLELAHWPGEPPQVEDLDLVWQRYQLRSEPVLLFDWKGADRGRKLA